MVLAAAAVGLLAAVLAAFARDALDPARREKLRSVRAAWALPGRSRRDGGGPPSDAR